MITPTLSSYIDSARVLSGASEAGGPLLVVSTVATPDDVGYPMAISTVKHGGYLILAVNGTSGLVQRVSIDGKLIASYSAGPTSTPWSVDKAANGTLALDQSSDQVLYVPENPYVFMKYDPVQGPLAPVPRDDREFQASTPNGPVAGMSAPGDRIMRTAFLPSGDVVVQVVARRAVLSSVAQSNVLQYNSYLELFDHSLKRRATGISVGQLQGATQDGALYFNGITMQGGIHIVRGKLSEN
jgi:hypothetical protein